MHSAWLSIAIWRPAEYIPLGWGSYDMGAFTPDGQPSEVMRILLASKKALKRQD